MESSSSSSATPVQGLPRDFEGIFREHYEFAHRTADRITGNSQDAEDVLQTLFLRLLGRELPDEVERTRAGICIGRRSTSRSM